MTLSKEIPETNQSNYEIGAFFSFIFTTLVSIKCDGLKLSTLFRLLKINIFQCRKRMCF